MAKKQTQVVETQARVAMSIKDVSIEQPKSLGIVLEVAGTAEYVQNRFSQKAIEQMLRKHMGLSTTRETKKPREVIESAKILNVKGRICVPPGAFKKAMITASTSIRGFKKTQLRTQLFVVGNSIPITYEEEIPRMDMVRTAGMGRTPDVRFRPSFLGWKARIALQFSDTIAVQSVVDLMNRAGRVGVGEWRPEKDGTFGTFTVSRVISNPKEIDEVYAECEVPLVPLKIPEWALDANIDPEMIRQAFKDGEISEKEGDDDTAEAV